MPAGGQTVKIRRQALRHPNAGRTGRQVLASRPVQRVVRQSSPSRAVRSGVGAAVRSAAGATGQPHAQRKVRQARQQANAANRAAQKTARVAAAVKLTQPKKTVFNSKIAPTGIAKKAAQEAGKYHPEQSSEQKVRQLRLKEQAGSSLPKPRLSTKPPAYGKGKNEPHPFKAGKGVSKAIDTVGRALTHGDPTRKYTPSLPQAVEHGAHVFERSQGKHPVASVSGSTPAVIPGPKGVKVLGPDKKTVRGVAHVLSGVALDTVNLPAGVPQTGYAVARAGVEAAQGNTKPAGQLWEGLKNHTFIGNAVQGKWDKALKQAYDHPLDTALEVQGAKAIVGRGTGGTIRAVGKVTGSKTLKRAGSTRRAPLKLYANTKGGPTHPRTYSKDSINKLVQVAADKVAKKRGHENAVKPGSRRQKHLLSQKVNSDLAMNEGVRRAKVSRGTAQVVHQTRAGKVATVRKKVPGQARKQATPGLKPHHVPAIPLAVERVLTTPKNVVRDLQRYRNTLLANKPNPGSHAELRLHDQTVRQVNTLLGDKKFLADPAPAFHAAGKVIKGEAPVTQSLLSHHLLSQDEHGAAYVPYAIVHMGAKPNKAGLPIAPDGHTLTVPEIKAHMQDPANHGGEVVPEPGFFSQRPGATGRGSFYTAVAGRNLKRPAMYSQHRSGLSTAQGTHEANIPALVAQRAHSTNLASQAEGHDYLFGKYGLHKAVDENGRATYYRNRNEANAAAEELTPTVGTPLVPVNIGNTKAVQDLLNTGQIEHLGHAGLSGKVHAMFEDTGHGQYILVPAMLRDKLYASVRPRGSLRRTVEEFTKHWKASVLTTSTHWPAGNAIDLTIRSAAEGIGPTRIARGMLLTRKVRQVNPSAADEIIARDIGAFMHSQKGMETFRPPNRLTRLPVAKQVAWVWKTFRDSVYAANGMGESLASYGALGKWAGQQMDGFIKVGGKGLEDLANGMQHTHNQEAAAAFVERVVGRWGKYSPQMRAVLIYAPFVQWLGVAMRYVYVTLPLHHPIKTAILAGLDEMTADERQKLGLYIDPFHDDKGQLAGYEQGGVRSGPDSNIFPFGGFSSFGILTKNPTNFLLPQGKNAYDIWAHGVDFKGQAIKFPDGTKPTPAEMGLLGLYSLLEPMVPFASSTRRVMEGGGAGNPTSWIGDPKTWPKSPGKGTLAGLEKVFNPFHTQRPFYPNSQAKGSSTKKGHRVRSSSGMGPGGGGGGMGPSGMGKSLEAKLPPEVLGGAMGAVGADKVMSRGQVSKLGAGVLSPGNVHLMSMSANLGKDRFKMNVALRPVKAAVNAAGSTATGLLVHQLDPGLSKLTLKSLQTIAGGPGKIGTLVPSGVPAEYKKYLAKYGPIADAEAHKYGLKSGAELLAKMLKLESGFNHGAVSGAGAKGAAQFMPADRQQAINQWGVDPYKNPDSAVHAMALRMGKGSGLAGYNPGSSSYIGQVKAQDVGNLQPTRKLTKAQANALKALARGQMAKHGNKPVRAGIFANPKNSGRIDMGWDVTGAGPVTAFTSGTITHVAPQMSGTGWPGAGDGGRGNNGALVAIKFDKPVKVGGRVYKYGFYAENFDPHVKVGQRVKAGQAIGKARGQMPFTEQGFAANAHGTTSAAGHYTEGVPTQEGKDFYTWTHGLPVGKAWGQKGGSVTGSPGGSTGTATGTSQGRTGGGSSKVSSGGGGSAANGSTSSSTPPVGFTQGELQALQLLGLDPNILTALGQTSSYPTTGGKLKLPKVAPVKVRALTRAEERSAL